MDFLQEWLNSMTPREIVGQIIGILVIIGCVLNAQFPKRWQMLLCQVFLNAFAGLNIVLMDQGLTASIPCALGAVHCTVNLIRDIKKKPAPLSETIIFCSLYPVVWGISFAISVFGGTASPLDLLTLAATACFVAMVLVPNEQLMRVFAIGNALAYAIYHIIGGNLMLFAYVFTIISGTIALLRYHFKKPSDTQSES